MPDWPLRASYPHRLIRSRCGSGRAAHHRERGAPRITDERFEQMLTRRADVLGDARASLLGVTPDDRVRERAVVLDAGVVGTVEPMMVVEPLHLLVEAADHRHEVRDP